MKSRLLKLLTFICFNTSLISISSCDALSFSEPSPLNYELNKDGESYSVYGDINKALNVESIIIPDTYKNKPVTKIKDNAFYGYQQLKNIELPESVLEIGHSAFYLCKSLENFNFHENIKEIKTTTFYGCESLKEIYIPKTIEQIGSFTFAGCNSLEKIIVDENNSFFDSRENCNSIISVKNNELIAGCKNSFIPDGIESIANGSFFNLDSLISITIPKSVVYLHSQAIQGCNALENITVDENNYYFDSRNNCNAIIRTSDNTLISGCKNTIIPNTVQTIGDEAFKDCTTLKEISIPSSVTTIQRFAFYGCSSLENIVIPNSVKVMKNQVFQDCNSLISVKIGDGLEEVDDAMFANCTLLEEIHLGRRIKRIGSAAFNNCPSIKDVYFKGSQEQWNTLNIEDNNEQLKNATIHYNS